MLGSDAGLRGQSQRSGSEARLRGQAQRPGSEARLCGQAQRPEVQVGYRWGTGEVQSRRGSMTPGRASHLQVHRAGHGVHAMDMWDLGGFIIPPLSL